jgi:hypothetical protein
MHYMLALYRGLLQTMSFFATTTPLAVIIGIHSLYTEETVWFVLAISISFIDFGLLGFIVSTNARHTTKIIKEEVFAKYSNYDFREIPWSLFSKTRDDNLFYEAVGSLPSRSVMPRLIHCWRKAPGKLMAGYTSYASVVGGTIFITEGPWTRSSAVEFWLLHEMFHHTIRGVENTNPEMLETDDMKTWWEILICVPIIVAWTATNAALYICLLLIPMAARTERKHRALWGWLTNEIEADAFAIKMMKREEASRIVGLFRTYLRTAQFNDPLAKANNYIRWYCAIENSRRNEAGEEMLQWPNEMYAVPLSGAWLPIPLEFAMAYQPWNVHVSWLGTLSALSLGVGIIVLALFQFFNTGAKQEKMIETMAPMITQDEIDAHVMRVRNAGLGV